MSRLHSPGRLFGLNLVGDVRHVKQQTDEPLTAGRWSQIGSVRTDVDLQCQDESLWRPWAEMQLRESPAEERRCQAGAEKCVSQPSDVSNGTC